MSWHYCHECQTNNTLVCLSVLCDSPLLWLSGPLVPNEGANHFLKELGAVVFSKHYSKEEVACWCMWGQVQINNRWLCNEEICYLVLWCGSLMHFELFFFTRWGSVSQANTLYQALATQSVTVGRINLLLVLIVMGFVDKMKNTECHQSYPLNKDTINSASSLFFDSCVTKCSHRQLWSESRRVEVSVFLVFIQVSLHWL